MKLLIVGSVNYDRNKEGIRIDCVSWEKLSDIQNVRDYDALLINLLNLQGDQARKKVDWAKFQDLFDFSVASDVLLYDGYILVLGDPRFSITHWKEKNSQRPFLYWTGISFHWHNQPGDTLEYERYGIDEFSEYRKYFHKWSYSLTHASQDETTFSEQWDMESLRRSGISSTLEIQNVCTNRYGHPLIFRIIHQLPQTRCSYGPILFLPKLELDEAETLQLVLRDFCDAALDLPEPDWIISFDAPGQRAIDQKITQIQTSIAEQANKLQEVLQERTKVRSCLKLLYEREFGLEPVVRDILSGLGAKVEVPIEKNKEDGWITVDVRGVVHEGVLEIKSTKSNQFGEDGRKQLLDWIERGRILREKNYKGIFIGNSAVGKPIKERPNAFSDSWIKAAALSHICAIKSEDLYNIHVLASENKVNLEHFWKKLFVTDGIFDITPFLPQEQPAPMQTDKPSI